MAQHGQKGHPEAPEGDAFRSSGAAGAAARVWLLYQKGQGGAGRGEEPRWHSPASWGWGLSRLCRGEGSAASAEGVTSWVTLLWARPGVSSWAGLLPVAHQLGGPVCRLQSCPICCSQLQSGSAAAVLGRDEGGFPHALLAWCQAGFWNTAAAMQWDGADATGSLAPVSGEEKPASKSLGSLEGSSAVRGWSSDAWTHSYPRVLMCLNLFSQ